MEAFFCAIYFLCILRNRIKDSQTLFFIVLQCFAPFCLIAIR